MSSKRGGIELVATSEETKMLIIKMDELDLNVPKVVQAVLEKMFKHF